MKINKLLTGCLITAATAAGAIGVSQRYASPRLIALQADDDEDNMPGQVPNKPENVTVTVPADGSHLVHFEFDAPTGVLGNLSNAGWLKYNITEANKYPEQKYAEGDCEYGQHVSIDVEIPAGNHKFTIQMENAKGKSSPYNYPTGLYDYVYVGVGIPTAPKNVVLTGSGNDVTLTWDAVTTATNTSAPFTPANVRYRVVRTPDEVTVADDLEGTTWSGTLPDAAEPIGYRFNVYALHGVEESTPTQSNSYAIGSATPAWSCEFNTINNFDIFSILDANSDGTTWKWDVVSRIPIVEKSSGGSPNKNDYLISPALILEAGKLYPVEVALSSYSTSYTEIFEVVGGTAPTVAGLTEEVIPETSVSTKNINEPMVLKGFYLAPASGPNYIAIHAKTPTATYNAGALSFSIGEGLIAGAPEGVEDLVITSDPDVAPPTAEISFKAPAVNIGGSALQTLSKIEILRGESVVKTFENPAPGASLSFTDIAPEAAEYTYYITAYNEAGAGRTIERKVFVGDYRIHAPYSKTFNSQDDLAGYTVINANGDAYYWGYSSSYGLYCSSSDANGDDYIVLPAIWLDLGYKYTFSAFLRSYWDTDYVPFEILMGTEPTVEGLTTVLGSYEGEAAKIGSEVREFAFPVNVKKADNYYFAIRYKSAASSCYLLLDKVEVSEGLNVGAPKQIADLNVVPDFGGELKSVITFTAPSKNIADDDLEGNLSKIEILCDGEIIHTLTGVAKGSAQTYTDEGASQGYHTYAVTPYALSKGETTSMRVYVGANIPLAPTSATIAEPSDGRVKLTWAAPEKDVDGNDINTALVSYTIRRLTTDGSEPEVVAEGVKATEYEYQAVEAGAQKFVAYRIEAVTAGGTSEGYAETDFIPVGTPYSTPISESFDDGTLKYEFLSEGLGGYYSEWIVYNDKSMPNLVDQDGTRGVVGLYSLGTAQSRLMSGKINVEGANPVFSVWFRAVQDSQNVFSLQIREVGTPYFTTLYDGKIWADGYANDWVKASVSVKDYVGKTVQIAINGSVISNSYIFFDNIRVGEQYPVNLRANEIVAPKVMHADEASPVTVTVLNMGDLDLAAGDYTVQLYRNGEMVQSASGSALPSDSKTTVEFSELHSVDVDADELVYYAVVESAADGDNSDNTTEEAVVTLRKTILPAVTDLKAALADNGVKLEWSKPLLPTPSAIDPVKEDFESYESFAKADIGDWRLVDGDGLPFGGFNESLPGIDGPLSYFVMDNEGFYDPYNFLAAHSGTKYLVSGYVSGLSDDWLISPQVSQSSHSVTFYAKSSDAEYPETFEVLYSLGSRETSDFKSIRRYSDIPNAWTKYTVTLPEGTRYFAIRCLSNDRFLFFVDDITYTPMDPEREALILKGYNVYRDGKLITDTPVNSTEYVDGGAGKAEAVAYTVKAVYVQGNAPMSNEVTLDTTGIGSIGVDEDVEYYDLQGIRVVDPQPGQILIEVRGGKAAKVVK